ncbi:hypothetical protein NKG05_20070 [Oerskovia sp. M15]
MGRLRSAPGLDGRRPARGGCRPQAAGRLTIPRTAPSPAPDHETRGPASARRVLARDAPAPARSAPISLKPRPGSVAVFTELDARKLGPVRRYFVRHPVVMDWFVAAWFAVPGLLSALLPPSQPRYGVALAVLAGVWRCSGAAATRSRRPPWSGSWRS